MWHQNAILFGVHILAFLKRKSHLRPRLYKDGWANKFHVLFQTNLSLPKTSLHVHLLHESFCIYSLQLIYAKFHVLVP
jgi:hypothetical protein